MALGLAGRLDFNPETDELKINGKGFKFQPPQAQELPAKGFVSGFEGYQEPEGSQVAIKLKPESQRVRRLEPFPPWDSLDFENLLLLCKARGKCTTESYLPCRLLVKISRLSR